MNHVQGPYANAICVLKVNNKCGECKTKLMSVLSSICGVYSVNIDVEKGLAEIQGQVDPNLLLQELLKSGQHAELVRIRLQHPAARQRYSSLSNTYGNAIQDGYRRMALLNDDQPYYPNGDLRYNNNNNLDHVFPEANSNVNLRYNTDNYAYASEATYMPSPVPPEYDPFEDETLNCTIL